MSDQLYAVLLCLCSLASLTSCDVIVREKTLKEINRVEIAAIETNLRGQRFPDNSGSDGDLSWDLTNIRVTYLSSLTADLDLKKGNQITWSGHVGDITVETDYELTYTSVFLPTLSADGSLTLRMQGIAISITITLSVTNGKLVIELDQCMANIEKLDIDVSGGQMSSIIDSFVNVVEGDIKNEIEKGLCEAVRKELADASEDMTSVATLLDIQIIGLPISLDTSFAAITVNDDNIYVNNKADMMWNQAVYSPKDNKADVMAESNLGMGFDLKTDGVNNIVSNLASSGGLNGDLAYHELKERDLDFLNLQCEQNCIGNALKTVSDEHPESVVGLDWTISQGGVEVQTDKLLGHLVGRVFFKAENATNAVSLFSAAMNLTTNFQARFAEDALSVRAVGLGGFISIDESAIGKVLSPNVKDALETFILKALSTELLKLINDYTTDYLLPLPERTSFKDAAIKLNPGSIRVEADICYKTNCELPSNSGEWVGDNTSNGFDVHDIIPTTTATTSTTPSTTTSRPTTKSTSTDNLHQTAGQSRRAVVSAFVLVSMYCLMKLIE